MKHNNRIVLLLAVVLAVASTTNISHAQNGGFYVTERGADYKVLQKTVIDHGTNRVRKYTQIETGLNFKNSFNQWTESKEEITIQPNGTAIANQGRIAVTFPSDIYSGVLEILTPDGRHLRSRPSFVSYDDGSNTVIIATLKHSQGWLTSSNQVTYRDAFEGIKGDVVVTYRRSGIECDLVIRQKIPLPDAYKLSNLASTLQLITEFFNTQDPQEIPAATDDWFGLQDSTLKFGGLTMTHGKAFAVTAQNSQHSTLNSSSVYKRWLHLQGRTFLIEEVPLVYLAEDLQTLPDATNELTSASPRPSTFASQHRVMPPASEIISDTNQILVASINVNKQPGVVLDYTTLDSDQTSFTFNSGTTYLITGPVYMGNDDVGDVVFAGGAVIKFTSDASTGITLPDYWDGDYETGPDNPVIFTSKDDDSVGETIDGSTGSPTTLHGVTFLRSPIESGASVPSYLYFFYAGTGMVSSDPNFIQNCRFINCDQGIYHIGGELDLYNVLFANCDVAVACGANWDNGMDCLMLDAENVTADNGTAFETDGGFDSYLFTFHNSLFTRLTNSALALTVNGTNDSSYEQSSATCYQTAGGAGYYLATVSSYRDIGTGGSGDWASMTTYAPQDGGFPDTNAPDLGYHYSVNEDSDHDGMPDSWEWKHFHSFSQTGTDDFDGDGVSNADEYNGGISSTDPNTIQFSIGVANNYVNTTNTSIQLNIAAGVPGSYAFVVDSTNFTGASWTNYTSTNITANLGTNEGWHQVWVGLRGWPTNSEQTWVWKRLKLDRTAPQLAVTSPTNNSTVKVPLIQLRGYSPEPLDSISYDITNALGLVTNQDAGITSQYYDTNTWDFTTNYFECLDVSLTNGVNTIIIHATDLAGNVTTTNFSFTLDYSSRTNPPAVQLFWPKNGEQICGSNFTWRGWVDDPTATVTAQVVNTNGVTNIVSALVERNGNFWAENMPMSGGTNSLTLTVTDSAGNTSVTNIAISPNPLTVTMTPIPDDQLWNRKVTASGTISDSTYSLWINGMKAVVADGAWTATNVPMTDGGTAVFNITTYAPGETQPDGSHGN